MTKGHLKRSTLGIILAVCSASTLAANNPFSSSIYFGAGLAQTNLELNEKNIKANNLVPGQSEFKTNNNGYTVFLGTKIDDHMSLEMGYSSLGDVQVSQNNQTNELFSVDSLFINTSLSYPVTQNTDVYAKLGISEWSIESTNSNFNDYGTGLNYGLGLDINIYAAKNRTLRVEWIHQQFDEIALSTSDTITASMVFNF